jgi:glutathione S-transferase
MANPSSDTIKLFVLSTGWGVPLPSSAPFPVKLATWMRMAKIPFEVVVENNLAKGPKGKSPWIELGAERMADSTIIIEHLQERFGVNLDAHLDANQRALALSVQRMLEEHYHQCFEHQLFFGRGGKERMAQFAATMPIPVRWILPTVAGRAFSKQLYARGMGRHPEEVIIAQGKADLDALSQMLGDKRYFFGDEPSSIDACIFGFLGVSVYVEGDNPLYNYAASKDNLMRYCERMRARYFPETLSTLAPLFPSEATTGSKPADAAAATKQPARNRAAVAPVVS